MLQFHMSSQLAKENAVDRLKSWVESKLFERFVITVIALNAITLGLETVESFPASVIQWLIWIDHVFLSVFVIELVLKLLVYRLGYFREPWRVFDFIIVFISLLPSSGTFSVLRSLRILRTLRMLSVVPSLRKVVGGLLAAIPGLGAVATIMLLIFYVGAVMATKLFGDQFPEWFGHIGSSSYTLFQIMTLESWSMGIVRPVMEQFPHAWLFFLVFILVTTFTMLNLFIAVIVNAMHADTVEAAEERESKSHDERELILTELKEIRRLLESQTRNSM